MHRGAREEREAFVGESQHAAERREHERSDHVEQEDDRDGLRDLFIARLDDRRRCRNGRAAADGRAYAHQRCDAFRNVERFAEHECHDERCGDGGDDHRQRLRAHAHHFCQVQAEPQQDDRILQDLLRGERDALARAIATLPHERDSHACQDAEDRAADQRKRLTKEGAAKRDSSANENAGNVELYLFEKDHR